MTERSFSKDGPEDLIVLLVKINGHGLYFVLDTGATHSVIDLNVLLMLGYEPNKSNIVKVETANGIVDTNTVKLASFSAIGTERNGFELLCYDFLQSGITSFYDGMLGLDFFENQTLTIDFLRKRIHLAL